MRNEKEEAMKKKSLHTHICYKVKDWLEKEKNCLEARPVKTNGTAMDMVGGSINSKRRRLKKCQSIYLWAEYA